VLLPDDVDFSPKGESPLARHEGFVNVDCPRCGGPAKRETDTMDTFVDSSWYFLRYVSPGAGDVPFRPEDLARWLPVDHYTGGITHAILHLLYARFFIKALHDLGLVGFVEPFMSLLNQGMVQAEGSTLSKSRGNIVEPLPLIERWGADTVRLTMMFAGPVEDDIDWATVSEYGVHKWIGRVWRAVNQAAEVSPKPEASSARDEGASEQGQQLRRLVHRTVKSVTQDMDHFRFNVAIAKLMMLTNEVHRALESPTAEAGGVLREAAEKLVLMLAPMAPHISEELWREKLGHDRSTLREPWPSWDEGLAREEEVVMVVQVDGRVRDRLNVSADISEERARELALASERVHRFLEGRPVADVVVRAPRLVNLVTEG
jgi:leucyl-tRNA synthetase